MTNFAILNFKSACIKFPRPCRLDFEKVITAETISEIPSAFEQLESLLDEGYHACIYICYEAAPAFDSSLTVKEKNPDLPLLYMGLSKELTFYNRVKSGERLADFTPLWSQSDYAEKFKKIQQAIYNGESYQLNLTFPLEADIPDDPEKVYQTLLWKVPFRKTVHIYILLQGTGQ